MQSISAHGRGRGRGTGTETERLRERMRSNKGCNPNLNCEGQTNNAPTALSFTETLNTGYGSMVENLMAISTIAESSRTCSKVEASNEAVGRHEAAQK